ncbi:hypothetical protein A6A19_07675 [Actinobacillus delphinicola]|uniref:Protein of uncharacterized function (DUF2857) n=1 Tax=Actinobacillus delphinicola TaxID=51161 RepID=A0A448TTY9_9PAST|nr:DUF2857 domain-containing protein [Actinobacillus delphinicola]MDG6897853.1 hypothetical protein [Actinobacillus delphinicola]VEJ09365.1 Protein of uncharacterised function (DUF2857) [Actinobacillus delphinicola]
MPNINQINQAIIDTVLHNLHKGEFRYCKNLGFTEKELMTLSKLSAAEIYDLCNSISTFVEVNINHQIFWNLMNAVRNKAKESNTVDRALALGISGEMLRHRFGWTSSEVSARRKLLGINESIGRKAKPSYEDEAKVWELWKVHGPKDEAGLENLENSPEGLDLLIFLSEETGVTISEIWRLISKWMDQ